MPGTVLKKELKDFVARPLGAVTSGNFKRHLFRPYMHALSMQSLNYLVTVLKFIYTTIHLYIAGHKES